MVKQRVVVTGANKGIGLAICRAILNHSSETAVLLGSRNLARGKAACDSLESEKNDFKGRVRVLQVDVSSEESVTNAAAEVRKSLQEEGGGASLYGVVNNAGIGLAEVPLNDVLQVNSYGIWRMVKHFAPLLADDGRIVNITSASGPNFVSNLTSEKWRSFFTDLSTKDIGPIEQAMKDCIAFSADHTQWEKEGLGPYNAYGVSKAFANLLTICMAHAYPQLHCNACTPGFIETDLTRAYAEKVGKSPKEMGMLSPDEGTKSALRCLFGETPKGGDSWYFGSDALRSPINKYRGPGDPEYKP